MNKKEIEQTGMIEGLLETVYTAVCSHCAVDHSDNTDESAFAQKLFKLGWRPDDNDQLFCPSCAKKLHVS
jgi:hypothetical protein